MDNNSFMTIEQINRLNQININQVPLNLLAITYPQQNNDDTISENDVMMDNSEIIDQLTELFETLPSISSDSNLNENQQSNHMDLEQINQTEYPDTNTNTNNYFYYTTCIGCIENQPNQLAHMGPHGCLEML